MTAEDSLAEVGTSPSPSNPYLFWLDPPGSSRYASRKPHWYDNLEVAAGTSFTSTPSASSASRASQQAEGALAQVTGPVSVNVNWTSRGAIHLFADPAFAQGYDDKIRSRNGPLSANMTGTQDSCGWPGQTPAQAPASAQWTRSTEPFHDDFSNGFRKENFVVATGTKQCCDGKNLRKNVDVVTDVVNGVTKNVVKLTATNADIRCPGPSCRKLVVTSGAFQTSRFYGAGHYEVVAKVPAASGMIWAIWTFHYEEHLPTDPTNYSCWCGVPPSGHCIKGECMPSSLYHQNACSSHGPDYSLPCLNTTLDDQWWDTSPASACGRAHDDIGGDPQFLGDASFSGYRTELNHEIDIEIPASCLHTGDVCKHPKDGTCAGQYNTANLNNYLYTNNGGLGPAFANMCVAAENADGTPMNFLGDGKYHTYAFDWHTGDAKNGVPGRVDFSIDGVYMGTNNAMVPTRGSRFVIAHWGGSWNGLPNDWGGGHAGDGQSYNVSAFVSSVSVTPFNEPNDIMAPAFADQPDGCTKTYRSPNWCHKWTAVDIMPSGSTDDDATDDGTDDNTPPPSGCSGSSGRPNGCACTHSWQCQSNVCNGHCINA